MNTSDLQARLEAVVRKFGAESGTVHLLENGVLILRAHVGIPEQVRAVVAVVPVGKGMAGLAALRDAPVNSCNIQTDTTGDVRPGARATGLSGAIVVPMRDATGAVRGTIGIGVRREYTYSAAETEALLAEGTAIADDSVEGSA